jgi:hypothetical protein
VRHTHRMLRHVVRVAPVRRPAIDAVFTMCPRRRVEHPRHEGADSVEHAHEVDVQRPVPIRKWPLPRTGPQRRGGGATPALLNRTWDTPNVLNAACARSVHRASNRRRSGLRERRALRLDRRLPRPPTLQSSMSARTSCNPFVREQVSGARRSARGPVTTATRPFTFCMPRPLVPSALYSARCDLSTCGCPERRSRNVDTRVTRSRCGIWSRWGGEDLVTRQARAAGDRVGATVAPRCRCHTDAR